MEKVTHDPIGLGPVILLIEIMDRTHPTLELDGLATIDALAHLRPRMAF